MRHLGSAGCPPLQWEHSGHVTGFILGSPDFTRSYSTPPRIHTKAMWRKRRAPAMGRPQQTAFSCISPLAVLGKSLSASVLQVWFPAHWAVRVATRLCSLGETDPEYRAEHVQSPVPNVRCNIKLPGRSMDVEHLLQRFPTVLRGIVQGVLRSFPLNGVPRMNGVPRLHAYLAYHQWLDLISDDVRSMPCPMALCPEWCHLRTAAPSWHCGPKTPWEKLFIFQHGYSSLGCCGRPQSVLRIPIMGRIVQK